MNTPSCDSVSGTPREMISSFPNLPIFIRGIMPRSGTNFLADTLKLHPDVAAHPNELWEFPHFRESPLLVEYARRIAAASKARAFQQDRFLRHLGDAWLAYLGEFVDGKKRIVMKEPSVDHLDTFFDFFPEATLLIIVRDGRDLLTSALKAGFIAPAPFSIWNRHSWRRLIQPSDFTLLCQRYADAARRVVRFERSQIAARYRRQICRVFYESLFADTAAEVRRVLKIAGLDEQRYDWDALAKLPVRGSSFLRDADERMDFGRG